MQSTDWYHAFSTPGCTVTNAIVAPIDGRDPAVPAGIVTDGVTLIGRCQNSTGGSTSSSSTSSNSSPNVGTLTATCPNLNYYNGASITNGYECVGTATVNGNSNYVGAVYTYQGSSSATGHEELGIVSSGCSAGSAVLNGGTVTLYNGQYEEPLYLRSSSAIWTATWWEGSGSPFTNWGTVCGSY